MNEITELFQVFYQILRELRDSVFLILGFMFGIVGTFITGNPRFTNRFLKIARIPEVGISPSWDGDHLKELILHYQIINGYPSPLHYHQMYLEFKDKDIKGNSPLSNDISETTQGKKSKWYLVNGDFLVQHHERSSMGITHNNLLDQLQHKQAIEYRAGISSSRYGELYSGWKTVWLKGEN